MAARAVLGLMSLFSELRCSRRGNQKVRVLAGDQHARIIVLNNDEITGLETRSSPATSTAPARATLLLRSHTRQDRAAAHPHWQGWHQADPVVQVGTASSSPSNSMTHAASQRQSSATPPSSSTSCPSTASPMRRSPRQSTSRHGCPACPYHEWLARPRAIESSSSLTRGMAA